LGYTEVTLGQKKTGIAKLRRAATELPSAFEVHDRLLQAYLAAERLPEAAEEAERFTRVAAHPALFLRAAGIRAQLKQWEKVETLSARGLQLFPESAELHDLLMKAYIVAGRLPAAAAVAERLTSVVAHPKVFLRAASIYAQLQQREQMERLLLRGLESFPDSTELRQALEEAQNNNKGTLAGQATTAVRF
jgi:tetratricopeptide (TPR) repeat protein